LRRDNCIWKIRDKEKAAHAKAYYAIYAAHPNKVCGSVRELELTIVKHLLVFH